MLLVYRRRLLELLINHLYLHYTFISVKDGACEDNPRHVADCPVWKERGYCSDNTMGDFYPVWMADNCKLSCGICQPNFIASTAFFVFKLLCVVFYFLWLFEIVHQFIDFPKPRQISTIFMPYRKVARAVCIIVPIALFLYL